VDRQGRAYQGNVERTVRASEGQQKLNQARRAVLDAVDGRIADREVPSVLVDLLNPGWRNLLVHAHLRHGADSAEWRRWLYVLDQLAAALSGRSPLAAEQTVKLLDDVTAGLESISFDPARRGVLLGTLRDALAAAARGSAAPGMRVDGGTTANVLGLDGVIAEANPTPVGQVDDAEWAKALERARRLKPGDWIALTEKGDKPSIVTIAFIGDEHASFVLVNRKGIKVRDVPLRDMARGLVDGSISVLDEFDLPLMERATHRMLQNMHNQLAYLAAHDELTGLINRKEFEKRVDRAIATARAQDYHHVVTYLDVDQFKVVNNTAGHAAGDVLLKQLAALLKRELRGTRHTLARLGGDEFGVLLERTSDEEGKEVADRQLDAIRRMRFDHEAHHFSVTASIGLVAVDSSTPDGGVALKLADAACYAAKDAGRNRVQVHAGTDVRLTARRGVMEWVTQIDRALDEDRLILNCQRIAPIRDDGDQQAHYEILLTMVDQNGNIMPPKDFVAAAETYNRMAAVDRWVVRHALNWMATHRRELESVGGFSVNLSGHSVNDEGFADFVLRQFSNTRVPTGKICFELTETAAIANLESAIAFMNKMTLIGCKFSLDDFGSGLSSYSYLRNLPVDYVKIDGVFVKDLATTPGDYAVVKSINEIAHFMGKKTVAEYVENNDILEQLREIGVDYAQGYGIERPRRLEEFFKF
jgi:diguanylate cyclase (GGDEF)-like protein